MKSLLICVLQTIKTGPAPLEHASKTPTLTLAHVRSKTGVTGSSSSASANPANNALIDLLKVTAISLPFVIQSPLQAPTAGSRNLLLMLGARGDEAHSPKAYSSLMARNMSLAASRNSANGSSTPAQMNGVIDPLSLLGDVGRMRSQPSSSQSNNKSMSQSQSTKMIDLGTPPKQCSTATNAADDARKQRALAILRRNGKQLAKTAASPLKSAQLRAVIREQKLHKPEVDEDDGANAPTAPTLSAQQLIDAPVDTAPDAKRPRLGQVKFTKEQIQELLKHKSRNEDLAEDLEREREQAYFQSMADRERFETKLTTTTEMANVKVVTCKIVSALTRVAQQFDGAVCLHVARTVGPVPVRRPFGRVASGRASLLQVQAVLAAHNRLRHAVAVAAVRPVPRHRLRTRGDA